jgi:hypothetical protein
MPKDPTTRALSDKHEDDIASLFGGRRTRGSGNQFRDQLDVRMTPGRHTPFAFGFDGKATRGRSLSVSLDGWQKLIDQAHDLRPAMPLRFYAPDNTLTPVRDLVVIELNLFAELLESANIYEEMRSL